MDDMTLPLLSPIAHRQGGEPALNTTRPTPKQQRRGLG